MRQVSQHLPFMRNGFSVFALAVTVFSLLMTAVLLAWQSGTLTVAEDGYDVRTAAIHSSYRSN